MASIDKELEKEQRENLLSQVDTEAQIGGPDPGKSSSKLFVDLFCIFLNIASTVLLVFLNNWIFRDPQLKKVQVSYAIWHFMCTTIVLYMASQRPFRLFVPVRLPFFQMIPLCSFFAGFLILGNLSLTFNPLGFYQIAKIMTTPVVALLQWLFLSKPVSSATMLSLAAVCVGVGLTNTGSGASGTNMFGASIAVASFTITAFYQVWIGKKLKDFSVSSPQLLLNQAPIASFLLLFMVPFFDIFPDVSKIPRDTAIALVLSGLAAALLNLSQFLIIGRMSALTFNVSSNVKSVIILSYGWISEGRPMTIKDAAGIALALGGASVYSQLSQGSSQGKPVKETLGLSKILKSDEPDQRRRD